MLGSIKPFHQTQYGFRIGALSFNSWFTKNLFINQLIQEKILT